MLETLIGAVTDAVFAYLLDQAGLSEKVRTLLKRDPQRLAFQLALTRTYAAFDRQHPAWTGALFDQHFLAHSAAPLLARCLLRSDPPTGMELANLWSTHLGLQGQTRASRLSEATAVAADFLATLDRELRARAEFQPLFDSRALDTTAAATAQTAEIAAQIVAELQALRAALAHSAGAPGSQVINNPAPNQGAQGVFYGPVYVGVQPPSAPSPASATAPAREGVNPFVAGNAIAPDQFYGRHDQRMSIRDRIGGIAPQCISIVGFRRSGKSSLLRYVRERIHEFCLPDQQPLVVSLSLSDQRFHTPEGITEGLRRAIGRATGIPPWPAEANGDAWAVDDALQELRDRGRRLIVLIDEFEQLAAHLAAFAGWGGDWREKAGVQGYLAMVVASLRPIDVIYKELGLASPFGNIFITTELGAMAPDDWQSLVHDGFARTNAQVSAADLALLDDLAGGLPYYTQLAASLLWRHGDHERTRAEFAHQVAPRFAELWGDLREPERHALRHAAGLPGLAAPAANLPAELLRHGLLRDGGRPFSSALADYLRALA